MRRADVRRPPPVGGREVRVPCPLCGGAGGRCKRCRGAGAVREDAPLRRLTDAELRVHASQLFDRACGFVGGPEVWALGAGRRIPEAVGAVLSLQLGRSFAWQGALSPRAIARACAREAGKVGARGAVRALCEVARRARRGSYGYPPESRLSGAYGEDVFG